MLKKAALLTAVGLLVFGCDDFGNINNDPNNPSQVKTELLLTNAQQEIDGVVGAVMGTLWVQYMAETQYDDDSRYATTSANFNFWYTDPLQDLNTIIELNSNPDTAGDVLSGGSNANQIAAAQILEVYFYQMMTDRWGAIPFSEALKGRENFAPSYDSQEEIYSALIEKLKSAVDMMDGGTGVRGDILFNGNMAQWAAFANSLRARAALRIADSNPSLASTEFVDALNDGIITEDVMYPYLSSSDNENPWFTRFRTRTDYAISDVLADYMKGLNDTRLTVYANPAPDLDNNDGVTTLDEINGMPYSTVNAGEITNASISFPGAAIGAGGPSVGQQGAPLPIITLAEMHFAMAEAIERGWMTGDAEMHYNTAIASSWQQWGVYDEAEAAAYLAQPEVAYDSAEWDRKIGYQKWIALYPLGYEGWSEWRRLGYPELEPHEYPLNESGEIPVRFVYPSTESQINSASYNAAVQMQGPDTPDTYLWWDMTRD